MEGWTAEQCAEHWGIRRSTWDAYVARGQAPKPVGWSDSTGHDRPMRVWDPTEVTARRPGAKRED